MSFIKDLFKRNRNKENSQPLGVQEKLEKENSCCEASVSGTYCSSKFDNDGKPLFIDTSDDKLKSEQPKQPERKLTAEEIKKIEKKMLKMYLRYGTPVLCSKCKQPGGKFFGKGYTLRKDGDTYVHVGNCPEANHEKKD